MLGKLGGGKCGGCGLNIWEQFCVSKGAWRVKARERAVKERQVTGSFERIMRGRSVNVDVTKGLRHSIVLSTLTYESETCSQESQQARECAVEIRYLSIAYVLLRWDTVSNEEM